MKSLLEMSKYKKARDYKHCRCPYNFLINDKKFVFMMVQINSEYCQDCESHHGQKNVESDCWVFCSGYQDYKYMWE